MLDGGVEAGVCSLAWMEVLRQCGGKEVDLGLGVFASCCELRFVEHVFGDQRGDLAVVKI